MSLPLSLNLTDFSSSDAPDTSVQQTTLRFTAPKNCFVARFWKIGIIQKFVQIKQPFLSFGVGLCATVMADAVGCNGDTSAVAAV